MTQAERRHMADALIILASYLIGSVLVGVLISRAHGVDVRERDLPGASGTYRQLGRTWGALVLVGDGLKGVAAALLATLGSVTWVVPLAGLAVVAGHLWPVLFGFRGGGGIATALGFFLVYMPAATLFATGIGLVVALAHFLIYFKRHRRGIYPLPFGSIVALMVLLGQARFDPVELWAVVLIAAAMLLRGLAILKDGPRAAAG